MNAISLLAFLIGFLSLCLEILWVRLFGYANYSIPQAFAWVLGFYLLGIAFGASFGKRFCKENKNLQHISALIFLLAGGVNWFGPLVYVQFVSTYQQTSIGAVIIFATAYVYALMFPLVHHLASPYVQKDVGRKVSRVYVANILGATLGPIVTTEVFLNFFTTQQTFMLCAFFCILIAAVLLIYYQKKYLIPTVLLCISGLSLIFCLNLNPHYLIAKASGNAALIRNIVENPYGVIVTYKGGEGGDYVYGGNVYDGRTNLSPILNTNRINRLLILPALQEEPRRVLLVGLSIGTWLKVITSFPKVERIDVIEINPGYLKMIAEYPEQSSALQDPRVHLVFDDGRRWLKGHPKRQYDLIVMNTTFHWRAYAANLLSVEFLTHMKKHMLPGAIFSYNSTGSPDALKTAAEVFRYAYLYENFIIAADFDWRQKLNTTAAFAILKDLRMNQKPYFPAGSDQIINAFLKVPVYDLQTIESRVTRKVEIITDSNLINEFKYGRIL